MLLHFIIRNFCDVVQAELALIRPKNLDLCVVFGVGVSLSF